MNIEAFYTLSYGLYAICTGNEKKKNGYIANTAFQVSASPAKFAISCSKDNFSTKMIKKSGVFSISVLSQKTKSEIIGQFGYQSGSKIDKFENVAFDYGKSGVPILKEDSLAWFECKVVKKVDVGTHILFIGELLDSELLEEDGTPLTYAYYRNVKKGLAPKNAPTYIEKEPEKKVDKTKKKPIRKKEKHHCLACNWEYDPEKGDPSQGIAPGTPFEDLPEDYQCPICGAAKDMFD